MTMISSQIRMRLNRAIHPCVSGALALSFIAIPAVAQEALPVNSPPPPAPKLAPQNSAPKTISPDTTDARAIMEAAEERASQSNEITTGHQDHRRWTRT